MRRLPVIAALLVGGAFAHAEIGQMVIHEGEIEFSLDAVTFYSIADSSQRLRIYWEIPNASLLFTRADSGYQAFFELMAIAYDDRANQVGGDSWRRSHWVDSYEKTLLETDLYRDNTSFPLPGGEYRLKLVVTDFNAAGGGQKILEISVPEIETRQVALSELVFLKNGIPSVEHSFRPTDTVFAVHEVYNLSNLEGYRLRALVSDGESERLLDSARVVGTELVKTEDWKLDFSDLRMGEYEMSLLLVAEDSSIARSRRKTFRVQLSPFLDDETFREALDQLKYVATHEEMKALGDAEPEDREKEWEAFWKEKDPTPSTEVNEFKDEYYRRIEYVNEHYGGVHKGWVTDRGRTYIIYGPPDEIERHPYELHSMPYEIWYYYARSLEFIFVDEHGIGDYRLVSPRGERW